MPARRGRKSRAFGWWSWKSWRSWAHLYGREDGKRVEIVTRTCVWSKGRANRRHTIDACHLPRSISIPACFAPSRLGFVRPTPIQADAIPGALAGRDVLACAQTGSGKTAAFLLPILQRLIDKPRGTTRALVLAPTRELAAQILEDLKDLAVHTPVTGAAVFGGVGHGPAGARVSQRRRRASSRRPGGCSITCARRTRKLDRIEYLVLDEADRMLDMGFLPEIRKILRMLPARRQTLFFSATMPPPIRDAGAARCCTTR